MMDLAAALWRKSSRSGSTGGDCVEVATNLAGVVAVRDSKNPGGGVLCVAADAWVGFAAVVKAGGLAGESR